jgi:hypothetical protein
MREMLEDVEARISIDTASGYRQRENLRAVDVAERRERFLPAPRSRAGSPDRACSLHCIICPCRKAMEGRTDILPSIYSALKSRPGVGRECEKIAFDQRHGVGLGRSDSEPVRRASGLPNGLDQLRGRRRDRHDDVALASAAIDVELVVVLQASPSPRCSRSGW